MSDLPSSVLSTKLGHSLVPSGVDLTDAIVWAREDTAVTGFGGATITVTGPDRLATTSRIWSEVAGRSTARLVAFFSSTFDDSSAAPTVLRIPQVLVSTGPDGAQVTNQPIDEAHLADVVAAVPAAQLTASAQLANNATGAMSAGGYQTAVEQVLDIIAGGRASKVVLARDRFVDAGADQIAAAINNLHRAYPSCWTFAIGGLYGATPELLAAKTGNYVSSRVLAGSVPRAEGAGDAEHINELSNNPRFAQEHALAARSVIDGLAQVVNLDQAEPESFVLTLPNIHHLATDVGGTVADEALNVIDVVRHIHPTAAVAGVPTTAALEVIRDVEQGDRGRYAGPVGWVDSEGDGEIVLAIRCGQIETGGVRVYGGGGIVAGADPQAEFHETETKMQPMLRALADS